MQEALTVPPAPMHVTARDCVPPPQVAEQAPQSPVRYCAMPLHGATRHCDLVGTGTAEAHNS